jgi:predicted YcjX-like family ATPase
VERAFSHYWHEKKKRTISFEFREVLRNYDLYQSYLEPGFYAEHLERFLELFPRHAILVQHFEHLRRDPRRFLDEFLTFAGLEGDFHPSVLNRRRNTAGPVRRPVQRVVGEATETLLSALPESARRFFLGSRLVRALSGRREYIEGISPELFEELLVLCEPEIRRVEALLDMELPAWRRPPAQP